MLPRSETHAVRTPVPEIHTGRTQGHLCPPSRAQQGQSGTQGNRATAEGGAGARTGAPKEPKGVATEDVGVAQPLPSPASPSENSDRGRRPRATPLPVVGEPEQARATQAERGRPGRSITGGLRISSQPYAHVHGARSFQKGGAEQKGGMPLCMRRLRCSSMRVSG